MGEGNWYDADIERVVVTEEQIRDKIEELAKAVAADYAAVESVLLVGVLKGAFMFMADFVRALGRQSRRAELEFMAVSSYGQRTNSSLEVKDPAAGVKARSGADATLRPTDREEDDDDRNRDPGRCQRRPRCLPARLSGHVRDAGDGGRRPGSRGPR